MEHTKLIRKIARLKTMFKVDKNIKLIYVQIFPLINAVLWPNEKFSRWLLTQVSIWSIQIIISSNCYTRMNSLPLNIREFNSFHTLSHAFPSDDNVSNAKNPTTAIFCFWWQDSKYNFTLDFAIITYTSKQKCDLF